MHLAQLNTEGNFLEGVGKSACKSAVAATFIKSSEVRIRSLNVEESKEWNKMSPYHF
jgi:hypothetical protein